MFKNVNPLLNSYAQESHENFQRTCVWTILTIMEQFNGQKRRMQDVDEHGAESKYLWGWKRKSYEYIQAHGKRVYDELMEVEKSALGVRKKNIMMMGIITEIPGLNLAKAGFVMQLMFGRVGCMDVHNVRRFKIKPADITIMKTNGAVGKDKKIKKYLSLCTGYRNSETLWDSWCNLVANKSCNSKHFDSGNDVSWFHLTSLVGE